MKTLLLFLFLFIFGKFYSQNIDINTLKSINLNRNTNLDPVFKAISNTSLAAGLVASATVFSIGYFQKDSSLKYKGIFIAEAVLVSAILTTALKYSVQRNRPFVTYPFIQPQVHVGNLSFPSGHTSNAFSTAAALSLAFPKWYVIAPAFIWAGAVGYSRMDLGVHYPTDVLAGAIIGSGSAFLCQYLNKKLKIRQKRPLPIQN